MKFTLHNRLSLSCTVSVSTHIILCWTVHIYVYTSTVMVIFFLFRLLHGRATDPASGQHTIHFLNVFLLVWGGAAVVTINTQLLRGKVWVLYVYWCLGANEVLEKHSIICMYVSCWKEAMLHIFLACICFVTYVYLLVACTSVRFTYAGSRHNSSRYFNTQTF